MRTLVISAMVLAASACARSGRPREGSLQSATSSPRPPVVYTAADGDVCYAITGPGRQWHLLLLGSAWADTLPHQRAFWLREGAAQPDIAITRRRARSDTLSVTIGGWPYSAEFTLVRDSLTVTGLVQERYDVKPDPAPDTVHGAPMHC